MIYNYPKNYKTLHFDNWESKKYPFNSNGTFNLPFFVNTEIWEMEYSM